MFSVQPHEVVKTVFRHRIGPVGEDTEQVFEDPFGVDDPAFVEVVSTRCIGAFEMGIDLLRLIGVKLGESRVQRSEGLKGTGIDLHPDVRVPCVGNDPLEVEGAGTVCLQLRKEVFPAGIVQKPCGVAVARWEVPKALEGECSSTVGRFAGGMAAAAARMLS